MALLIWEARCACEDRSTASEVAAPYDRRLRALGFGELWPRWAGNTRRPRRPQARALICGLGATREARRARRRSSTGRRSARSAS